MEWLDFSDFQTVFNLLVFFFLAVIGIAVYYLLDQRDKELDTKIKANQKKIAANNAELKRLIAEDKEIA